MLIFKATFRASWLFFRVARLTRMSLMWAIRGRLKKQPLTACDVTIICETGH